MDIGLLKNNKIQRKNASKVLYMTEIEEEMNIRIEKVFLCGLATRATNPEIDRWIFSEKNKIIKNIIIKILN